MTAENNGTGAPQDDDPFAYLYRSEGGGADGGAASAQQQRGVPRRSYHQVRAVGQHQYGAQHGGQGQQFGQTVAQQQPGAYGSASSGQGQPSAHYAAPETMPGGRAATRQQAAGRGGQGGRGGSRNGLLIGAVAVVAAVVIGIGAAMVFNDDGGDAKANGSEQTQEPDQGNGDAPEDEPQGGSGDGEQEEKAPPKEDASTLRLEGGARVEGSVPGAKARNGTYVAGMDAAGATAKWTTEVSDGGTYDLYVRYAVPGEDMHLSLGVNDEPHPTGLKMKNFAKAEKGDWEKGWTYTFATVQVKKGENSFAISCGDGDKCTVNLDQVWLKPAG
ncbi:hypothetical protein [Streptomyces phytohabitans]|uniref:hypothetical protein n=1 Tax=Streptomyces phytohabitans TaxID=1150371 RepID=UPI00345BCF6D